MVMRTIPELLNDSSSHVSIAVARHLKEGSPPPSSSSDSDADVDELPFIPMPLSMAFSGSRMSLNDIPGDEDADRCPRVVADGDADQKAKRGIADEKENTERAPLKKESSAEFDESQTKARRATMRRGSSADSALLLHIDPEEGSANEDSEATNKSLKKAVSMELPNRSPSPGVTKLSQEDYALKLELMRQRLLRGGNTDKKLSGLRGPLFETLGRDDDRWTGSLDRNLRKTRAGPSTLTRAASSESSGEDTPKTKVFRKSASFTQGDSEPMPLHRRFGAPLEIPTLSHGSVEGKKLQEACSVSALTEPIALESASPTKSLSFILPTQKGVDQQQQHSVTVNRENAQSTHEKSSDGRTDKRTKSHLQQVDKVDSESRSPSVITPIIVIEEDDDEEEGRRENQRLYISEVEDAPKNVEPTSVKQSVTVPSGRRDQAKVATAPAEPNGTKPTESAPRPAHPAVFAKVATTSASTSSSSPDLPTAPRQPVLRTDIKDIDSEEIFEARFKKRESSLTRGLRKLTRNKSEEKSPILGRKVSEGGEEVYRPGPRGAPLEMVTKGLQGKSKSVQDLREEDKEPGLGLIGRFSLRAKRSTSVDKKGEKLKEEKRQDVQESAVSKRVSWAIGRSRSLDTNSSGTPLDERKAEESSVSAMRRKFESKVAGFSAKIRTQSEERKDKGTEGSQTDLKKVADSPVLAMRQKFENKVAGMSSKIRSQSEERNGEAEAKRTPLVTRHRHSQSEGRGLKGMSIPENQLVKQSSTGTSKESIESTSSAQSEKAPESDRRSRWDRWGLTRGKKDKSHSQPDVSSSAAKEDVPSTNQRLLRSASDFPPVFHIKLRDHVLLEGEPVTLSCLPAGSPHPEISWMKGEFQHPTFKKTLTRNNSRNKLKNFLFSRSKTAGGG